MTDNVRILGEEPTRAIAKVSIGGGCLGVMTREQLAVEEGLYFSTGWYDAGIVTTGTREQLLRMPASGIDAAAFGGTLAIGAEGLLELFLAPATTDDGTPLAVLNVNRNSTNTALLAVFDAPTVSDPGTPIFQAYIPGGGGPQSAGAEGGNFERLRLKPGEEYLVRVTNLDNNTQKASLGLNWYEERP